MDNVYLIGLPGCGKSTVGKRLARCLGMNFIDLDREIEQTTGQSITALFKEQGEAGFRLLETHALERTLEAARCVVATGGGIVLRPENIGSMKRGGRVVWLDRSVDEILKDIDTRARPLLADNRDRLRLLADQRIPLYKITCDMHCKNLGSIDETVCCVADWVKKSSPST